MRAAPSGSHCRNEGERASAPTRVTLRARPAGSLSPGKRADLILIRTNDVNVAPLASIESTVVQSATPANVDTVFVDGRIVKREGQLVGYDVAGIVERAKRSAMRIRKSAGGVLAPVCDGCGNPVARPKR